MRYLRRNCLECKQQFLIEPKYDRPGRGIYCSKSCATVAKNHLRKGLPATRDTSGENNPNWRGGVSKDNMRYKLRFESKSPEKVAAHKAVHKAIRLGSITRQPCINCGIFDRIHAHHEDYSRPLDVMWLCQQCHIQHHARGGVPL